MRELEYRLLETARSDFAFLRSVGIEPCVIDRPLPLPYPGQAAPTDHGRRRKMAQGVRHRMGARARLSTSPGFLRQSPLMLSTCAVRSAVLGS